ncbi:Ubiquitin carboxyl-terminal hydrolase 17 [Rhynchospora pubera]|uniref:ubiquitinyl hydrolase 1 n=1 Tax=Rhynchospora pubera TaxID=906938 RepID=A0AAV8AYQ2_9POAL|nr:Ubiquitin carboxyl-terminal hydrolase 17 [Rhynchospora pubera]KAJ4745187.1 Ubiquitin carboxyl-terminal hydrolase 17 [Rhynchospora pubera]
MGETGGHLGWALVLLFLGPVLAFVVRRRWRNAAARAEEVRRLALLAAAEAERAEMEAFREYTASIMRESGWVPQPQSSSSVVVDDDDDAPSPSMAQPAVYATVSPSPSLMEKRPVCAVCFRETTTRCARCKAVRYCSGKCQIIHWRQGHKDECREPQIQTDNKPNGQASAPNPSANSKGARVDKPKMPESSPKFEAPALSQSSVEKVPKSPSLAEPNILSSTVNADSRVEGMPNESQGDNNSGLLASGNKVTVDPAEEPHIATATQPASVVSPPSRSPEEKLLANNKEKTDNPVQSVGGTPPVIPNSGSGTEKNALKTSKSSVKEVTAKKMVSNRRSYSVVTESAKKVSDALRVASKLLDNDGGVSNETRTAVKNFAKQHSISKVTRHYPTDLMLFPYDLFLKLYISDRTDLRPFGLANCGNSCYANTVLQCLTFTRPLTAYLLEGLHTKKCGLKTDWCFTCEFERLVLKGRQGIPSLSPANILSGLRDDGSPFGQGREEDAHEFMKYVIEKMQAVCVKEAGIPANHQLAEETTLVQLIFGGYLRSKIKCMKCHGSSDRGERMMDLTLPIEGNITTLEEALAKFTSSEVLDGDNKYQCDRCKSYERARKKMTILEAPNVLTIALKRYQSGKFGKINKPVRFPEHLNLAQYMSGTEDKSPVYSLYAVVVHRDVNNAAFSGHYVCYVKDTRGKWYEVNDSMVEQVSLETVLSKCAYLLLYARCSPRAPSSIRRAMAIDPVPRKLKHHKPTNLGGSSGPNQNNQPPLYLFEDGHHNPSEYSSDSSSLFSNSDEGSSSMSTESMASVDSSRNSTSNEESTLCDFFFGDSDRISSGILAGPNTQFEDSGGNPVPNMASRPFLYTDSSGDSVVGVSAGLAGHSSRKETDWGAGQAEGTGNVLSRRPARERLAQTFYS